MWAIYIFLGLVHLFSCSRIGRPPIRGIQYINRWQKLECRNCSRAVPFLWIFSSNFHDCVFVVHILAEAFNQTARTPKHWAGKYVQSEAKIYRPLEADAGALIHNPVKVLGDLKKNNCNNCLLLPSISGSFLLMALTKKRLCSKDVREWLYTSKIQHRSR